MRSVLYVTRSGIPNDASGIRVNRMSQLIQELGYTVTILSFDDMILSTDDGQSDDFQTSINGVKYLFNCRTNRKWYHKYLGFYNLLFAKSQYRRVVTYCEKSKPSAIILYNDFYSLTRRLLRYCKKRQISLYADVTEWYEKRLSSATISERIVPYLVNKRITTIDKKLDGVIAISQYLYDYYNSLSVKVIQIPPLMPVIRDIPHRKQELKTLVYAGSPGDKDILVPILEAFSLLNSDKVILRLNIVGLTEKEVGIIWKEDPLADIGVQAYGRLSHEKTLEVVSSSDFGVLFRHNLRYAKAGFSTKFAECMSLGIPMLCNRVGGCDTAIENKINGFLIDSLDISIILECLEQIVELTSDEIFAMKTNALKTAQSMFDSSIYINRLKKFCGYEDTDLG